MSELTESARSRRMPSRPAAVLVICFLRIFLCSCIRLRSVALCH